MEIKHCILLYFGVIHFSFRVCQFSIIVEFCFVFVRLLSFSLQREARYRFHKTKIFDEFLKLF